LIETQEYKAYLASKEREYEAICKQCGLCCGALNDPCQHLKKIDTNRYTCDTYQDRAGKHQTISNKTFTCVSIRDLVEKNATPYGCAYSKKKTL